MTRIRLGPWVPIAMVILAVAWVVYRHTELRMALQETLMEMRTLQVTESRLTMQVRAYEAGFLQRRTSAFSGPFLAGTQWMPDGTKRLIAWQAPENGTYLVVDWQCPWSRAAAQAALATAPQVILIDPDADNGDHWRSEFASMADRVLVVTPEQGWWHAGVPSGITPVWFTFAAGEFTAVGIGAEGVRSPDSPASPEPLRPSDFTPIDP